MSLVVIGHSTDWKMLMLSISIVGLDKKQCMLKIENFNKNDKDSNQTSDFLKQLQMTSLFILTFCDHKFALKLENWLNSKWTKTDTHDIIVTNKVHLEIVNVWDGCDVTWF